MDAFHGTRGRQSTLDFGAACLSRRECQHRPHPLSTGKQAVTHCFVDRHRLSRGTRQKTVERAVDETGTLGEIFGESHEGREIANGKRNCKVKCHAVSSTLAKCQLPVSSSLAVRTPTWCSPAHPCHIPAKLCWVARW